MKEQVTNYLKSLEVGKTPTEIGLALGKNYNTASSSVNGSLKSLLKDGKITKSKVGGKVLYTWIKTDNIFTCECGWSGTVSEMKYRSESNEHHFCDQHECPKCLTVLINNLD